MKGKARRLLRLARAQSGMAQLLQARMAREARNAEALLRAKDDISATLDGANSPGTTFYSAALRRLIAVGEAIVEGEALRRELEAKLRIARRREDVLLRRVAELRLADERRALSDEVQDASLSVTETAMGKPRALK